MKGYDLELLHRSQLAFIQLADLAAQEKPNQAEVISVVREHRVALECFKYRILEHYGSDAFIVIQSALDAFYMDNDANHLHFHIHTKTAKAPYFQRQISSPQKKGVLINKQSTL
ncbi:hypothetical protein [Pseudoalteromonas ruthenica]|nr:hypothetical protein [Pseudoalteromonas ruthenica]